MRVTSGQTAEEIIDNIAPRGQGERQMLFRSQQDVTSASQAEVAPQFIVIHEDELLKAKQATEVVFTKDVSVCSGSVHDRNC